MFNNFLKCSIITKNGHLCDSVRIYLKIKQVPINFALIKFKMHIKHIILKIKSSRCNIHFTTLIFRSELCNAVNTSIKSGVSGILWVKREVHAILL